MTCLKLLWGGHMCAHALQNVKWLIIISIEGKNVHAHKDSSRWAHGCRETHTQMPLGAEMLPCVVDEGLMTGAVTTEPALGPGLCLLSQSYLLPLAPYMQGFSPSMPFPSHSITFIQDAPSVSDIFANSVFFKVQIAATSSRKPRLVITSFTCP